MSHLSEVDANLHRAERNWRMLAPEDRAKDGFLQFYVLPHLENARSLILRAAAEVERREELTERENRKLRREARLKNPEDTARDAVLARVFDILDWLPDDASSSTKLGVLNDIAQIVGASTYRVDRDSLPDTDMDYVDTIIGRVYLSKGVERPDWMHVEDEDALLVVSRKTLMNVESLLEDVTEGNRIRISREEQHECLREVNGVLDSFENNRACQQTVNHATLPGDTGDTT